MSDTPPSFDPVNMPSESSFKQHAEVVRSTLSVFHAIKGVDAVKQVQSALDDLIIATADFQRFATFFTNHNLFQELIPAAYSTLEEFFSKRPGFEKHPSYSKVVALNTRVQEYLQIPVKKGTIFFSIFPIPFSGVSNFWALVLFYSSRR